MVYCACRYFHSQLVKLLINPFSCGNDELTNRCLRSKNVSAGFCSQWSLVHEHGGYFLGGIHIGQHCARQSTRTRSLCVVTTRRVICGSILAFWWIFTAKKSWVVLLPAKIFGSLNHWFILHCYSLISFLWERPFLEYVYLLFISLVEHTFLYGRRSYSWELLEDIAADEKRENHRYTYTKLVSSTL